MTAVDDSKLVPVDQMKGDSAQDTRLLRRMLDEARAYLLEQGWCRGITESHFGLGVGGIVAVFLFRITPAKEGVDDLIWVVVGDLPTLYITVDDAPNAACALDGYIGAMQAWVDAVLAGKSVRDLAPIGAEPTPEMAKALASRLTFLDREVLSGYRDDLRSS